MSAPTECTDGTYQANTGQTSCSNCDAGKQCADKTISPVDCNAGFYSNANSISCISCASGRSSSCIEAFWGKNMLGDENEAGWFCFYFMW